MKGRNALSLLLSLLLLIAAGAPLSASALELARPLAYGTKGDDVANLQQFLKDRGYFTYPQITGYFGSFTWKAVAGFQRDNGLESVGIVGPKTLALLAQLESASSPQVAVRTPSPSTTAPPRPPRSLKVDSTKSDMVILSWDPVADAISYTLKRMEHGASAYVVVATNLATTTYADTNLEPSGGYSYIVTAHNAAGESGFSSVIGTTASSPGSGGGGGSSIPSGISLSASSIAEDATVGTTIGTLGATANHAVTYSIVSNPGNKFSISGTSFKTAAALDYETSTSHVVTIRATDTVSNLTYDEAFTISVTNVSEGPAWLPTGAIAYADFQNGHYYASGAETTLTGMFEDENSIFGYPFSSADVSSGSGLTAIAPLSGAGPVLIPSIAANFISSGATIILDTVITDTGSGLLGFDFFNTPAYTTDYFLSLSNPAGITFQDGTSRSNTLPVSTGHHKFAATVSSSNMSVSEDGSTGQGFTPNVASPAYNTIGFFVYKSSVIRSITIYSPKADSELPALSAL